jgi:hypothetical protein
VPLRTYLWLLVPTVVGVLIGLGLAHRAGGPPVHAAAVAVQPVARCCSVINPPRRVYRNVKVHVQVGLTPLHESLASAGIAGTATGVRVHSHGPIVVFSVPPRSGAESAASPSSSSSSSDGTTVTEPTSPGGDTTTTPSQPVSTAPIEITNVRTTSLGPFSAHIEWQTSEPVTSEVAYGLDSPTLWSAADTPSVDHSAVVDGLTFDTTYRLWVQAQASDGRTASSPFLLTTPPLSGTLTGSTANGAFLVDGNVTFPTVVWAACRETYGEDLAAGIDLFMGKDCGSSDKQLADLGNRGFLVTDAQQAAQPGAVGTFLPDEWDTFLPNNLSLDTVQRLVPNNGGGPRFQTLTNHFYSHADPLPQGRGMYPALIQNADVLSFDLYPLQNWCRYDQFGVVFDSQRELVRLAAGKPTFQWIEAREMDCHDPSLDPTPETVHAETWLAIAGGAHLMGYFPKDFGPGIGAQIAADKRQIETLVPALLDQELEASADGSVKVGARQHNGAIYVIAVNASRSTVTSTITVPSLGERPITSLDGTRTVTPAAGAFSDTFAPLAVHIYIAAPPTS